MKVFSVVTSVHVALCLGVAMAAGSSTGSTKTGTDQVKGRHLGGMTQAELDAENPAMSQETMIPPALSMMVEALGGEDALLSFTYFELGSEGITSGPWQGAKPGTLVNFSTYERITVLNDKVDVMVDETIQPLFQSFQSLPPSNVTRTIQGEIGALEGNYILASNGSLSSASVAALKHQQYLFNPHLAVRDLLEGRSQLLNYTEDSITVSSWVAPMTFAIDMDTGFIDSLTTQEANPLVGDLSIMIVYSNWTFVTQTGLVFPEYVAEWVHNKFQVWEDYRYWADSTNEELGDEVVFPLPPDMDTTVDEAGFAYGLFHHHTEARWFMAGFDTYPWDPTPYAVELVEGLVYVIPNIDNTTTAQAPQSMVIATNGGQTAILLEAPSGMAHGQALVDLVMQEVVPGAEQISHLIQSLHHIDHAGGVRQVMGMMGGSTQLVVGNDVAEWYASDVFNATATLVPDAWADANFTANDAMIYQVDAGSAIVLVNETDLKVFVSHYAFPHAEDSLVTLVETAQGLYIYTGNLYNAGLGFTVTLDGPAMFFDYLRGINVIDDACESDFPVFFVGAFGAPYLSLEDSLAELDELGVGVGC